MVNYPTSFEVLQYMMGCQDARLEQERKWKRDVAYSKEPKYQDVRWKLWMITEVRRTGLEGAQKMLNSLAL